MCVGRLKGNAFKLELLFFLIRGVKETNMRAKKSRDQQYHYVRRSARNTEADWNFWFKLSQIVPLTSVSFSVFKLDLLVTTQLLKPPRTVNITISTVSVVQWYQCYHWNNNISSGLKVCPSHIDIKASSLKSCLCRSERVIIVSTLVHILEVPRNPQRKTTLM